MITKENTSPITPADSAMLEKSRTRYATETRPQGTETLSPESYIETRTDRRPAFIYWLDRFFPRIVIGRRGPGQR